MGKNVKRRGPGKVSGRRRHSAKPKVVYAESREIILVDGQRVRRKALTDYKRAKTTFGKAEAELEHYERVEVPAYRRWYRGNLGPLLMEMDEVRLKQGELQRRIRMVEGYAELKKCSFFEAASLLEEKGQAAFEKALQELLEAEMRRQREEEERRQRELEELIKVYAKKLRTNLKRRAARIRSGLTYGQSVLQVAHEMIMDFAFSHPPVYHNLPDFMESEAVKDVLAEVGLDVRAALEEDEDEEEDDGEVFDWFTGGMDDPFAQFEEARAGRADAAGLNGAGGNPLDAEARALRMKQLRRELAFALHPDQGGKDDPQKLALWHEVQEALEMNDLDRLEVIQGHVEIMGGGQAESQSVSILQKMTAMFRESREALRRRLRHLRKTPEWNFTQVSEADRKKAVVRLKNHFETELRGEYHRLKMFEQMYAEKKKQRGKSGPRYSDPMQMLFGFEDEDEDEDPFF